MSEKPDMGHPTLAVSQAWAIRLDRPLIAIKLR